MLGEGSFFRNISCYVLNIGIFSQRCAPSHINQSLCICTQFHQLILW